MTSNNSAASSRPPIVQRGVRSWPSLWGPHMWRLMAFLLALFLYRIWVIKHSQMSLFPDEAQYWDWSKHLALGYFSKPPLIAGLIALSTALFGDGELAVKCLIMVLYPITALCMVGFTRALWPTNSGVRTGMVAAALFMSLPMVGWLGLFATTDAPLILCWTLASWALWRAQVTNRLFYWVMCGLACGVGLIDKYTMAAFALTAIWTLWGIGGPKRGIWRIGPWVSLAIALAVLAPNLWWNAQAGYPTFAHTSSVTTHSNSEGGLLPAFVFMLGQIAMLGPLTLVAAVWLATRPQKTDALGSMPPSYWASSHQTQIPDAGATSLAPFNTSSMSHSTLSAPAPAPKPKTPRNTASHLASVSSYRFLWVTSLPLQLVAIVQAMYANAHLNWAAPSMVGFVMLAAAYLSPPLSQPASPKPNRWLVAILASNVLLASVALHLRSAVGPTLPSRLDVLERVRGWREVFHQLAPALDDPTVKGLPILTDQRVLATEALYYWRRHHVSVLIWNPTAQRRDHYEMMHSLPNKIGADMLLLVNDPHPTAISQHFATAHELQSAEVPIGPGHKGELHLFFLRGFLGYDQESYLRESDSAQSGKPDEQ